MPLPRRSRRDLTVTRSDLGVAYSLQLEIIPPRFACSFANRDILEAASDSLL